MKKRLTVILACIVLIASFICVSAFTLGFGDKGFEIQFNGEDTGYTSVVHNDKHFVPMRKIFEKLGAQIFYRSSDRQILVLSRDGDIFRHYVGANTIIVNGEEKVFEDPTILANDETYMPIDMLSAAFCPDGVTYENRVMNIKKHLFNTDYHKVIQDVMDVCRNSNFYPERFQRYINLHNCKPSYTIQEVLYRVNLGLDYPFYENITTIEHPYELLVLVNKYYKLPSGFKQFNLVNMKKEYTVNDGKEYLLESGAYNKFVQMSNAAKKDGLTLKVISAYRTESYQAGLYNNKLRSTGIVNADNYSARPGHSEHQTGLAVDINSTSDSFENTAEFRWLQKHAHEYGYIMRYHKGKEWITGYAYEPWHYRYVGLDAAKIIHEEGITYEEYYAKYVSVNEFK